MALLAFFLVSLQHNGGTIEPTYCNIFMPIYILFTLTVNILKKLPFTFQFIGCHFILASYFLKQNIHDFTCRKEEKVREYGCWTFLILYSSCFCSPVGSTWHLNNVETDLLCKWGLREQKRRWDEKTPKYFQIYIDLSSSSLAWSKTVYSQRKVKVDWLKWLVMLWRRRALSNHWFMSSPALYDC